MKHRLVRLGIVALGIISVCLLHSTWSEVHAQSQDDAAIARQFVGMWRLVSWPQRLADGTWRSNPTYGPGGVGYLIYTEANRMCAMVMDPSRPLWNSESSPTEAELRSAMNGLTAYCGTYEVNAAEGFVVHHVEVERIPNRVGTSLKRFFTFSGNRLLLRPAERLPKDVLEHVITWERVEK